MEVRRTVPVKLDVPDKRCDDLHQTIQWADSFWADSYCLISTGQVSLNVLKEHVENQRERDDG